MDDVACMGWEGVQLDSGLIAKLANVVAHMATVPVDQQQYRLWDVMLLNPWQETIGDILVECLNVHPPSLTPTLESSSRAIFQWVFLTPLASKNNGW